VFFRSQNFEQAMTVLSSMFALAPKPEKVLYWNQIIPAVLVIGAMVFAHWRLRSTTLEAVAEKTPAWIIGSILAFMLFMLVITQGSDSAFIYFQF
jgi:hypothetical protein